MVTLLSSSRLALAASILSFATLLITFSGVVYILKHVNELQLQLDIDMKDFQSLSGDVWAEITKMHSSMPTVAKLRKPRSKWVKFFAMKDGTDPENPEAEAPRKMARVECGCSYTNNCPPGPVGIRGRAGRHGIPGHPGGKGFPGTDAEHVHGRVYNIGCSFCPQGPPGDSGDPGKIGARGIRGVNGKENAPDGNNGRPGHPGIRGEQGSLGPAGVSGDVGWPGHDASIVVEIPGPKGEPGGQGEFGASGTTGRSGYTGDHGTTGIIGYKGAPGYKGELGLSGTRGNPGNNNKLEEPTYCNCKPRGSYRKIEVKSKPTFEDIIAFRRRFRT